MKIITEVVRNGTVKKFTFGLAVLHNIWCLLNFSYLLGTMLNIYYVLAH